VKFQIQPTVAQLRELSRGYRRPIGMFYLSERPVEFQPMRDFHCAASTERL
jgi:hypothetical protein